VPPTRFRPASKLGDAVFENPANVHLTNILRANARIIESREGGTGGSSTERVRGAPLTLTQIPSLLGAR
jgi:hypothetical protein